MTREEMEAVWNRRGMECGANRTIWTEDGPRPGEACNPKLGKDVERNRRRLFGHETPTAPHPGCDNAAWPLYISKETRSRYKKMFPRNYKELLAAYGKTYTKYDADQRRLCGR